jgi:flagellar hook-associated protein 3 FlgL
MNLRFTNNSNNSIDRINTQRGRLSVLQERLMTQKRINRPSDDPAGAEAVINLRTSQNEIQQFSRSAAVAREKLTASDDSLNNYENVVTRLKTLISQGLTDTTTRQTRDVLAAEIESLHGRVLSIANTKFEGEYLFGGTRQNAAPFDASANQPATPATPQYIQIEPGATAIAVGTTADKVFGDGTTTIFADLNTAVAALKGSGDPAADRAALQNTMNRLDTYASLSSAARTRIGVNMNTAETAIENLSNSSLTIEERISGIETADFAETAIEFSNAQQVLEATLQAASQNRRSLFDFLG